jgi:hypothetical protein
MLPVVNSVVSGWQPAQHRLPQFIKIKTIRICRISRLVGAVGAKCLSLV